jgi:hypothetical protein
MINLEEAPSSHNSVFEVVNCVLETLKGKNSPFSDFTILSSGYFGKSLLVFAPGQVLPQ